jgi:hypothetical protein
LGINATPYLKNKWMDGWMDEREREREKGKKGLQACSRECKDLSSNPSNCPKKFFLPVILVTQAEIRSIGVQSQPKANSSIDPIKKFITEKKAGGVAQSVGPEFKLHYHKKKGPFCQ